MTEQIFEKIRAHRVFAIAAILLAVFQIGMLSRYPAATHTDSLAYLAYADLILKSFATGDYGWAQVLDLDAGLKDWGAYQWERPDTYRMIGYPLVIAMTRIFAGDNYQIWLLGLQTVLSFVATVFVYSATLEVTKHKVWATFGALAYALSPAIFLQNAILNDSLYSSLLVIVFCLAVISFYRQDGLIRRSLAIGLILGLSFLFREITIILVAFLPALLAPVWFAPATRARKTIAVVLMFLPISSAYVGYGLWNQDRSGYFFMTLNSLHYTLFEKYRRGVPAFSYGEPIDIAALKGLDELRAIYSVPKDKIPTFDMTESPRFVGSVFATLHREFGYNQYDMYQAFTNRNILLVFQYPFAAVEFAIRDMVLSNPNGFPPVMGMALSPFTEIALLESQSLKKQARSIMFVIRAIRAGEATAFEVAEVAVRLLFRLIPLTIFLLYLAALPLWLIFRRSKGARETAILASIWVVFIGLTSIYSLFNFEVKYVLAGLPAQIIAAIVAARLILQSLSNRVRRVP
ncbi:MAG TPA: hypothetical protein ENI69_10180 [Rhodospirillales bacterium]|nr:hypothetical protein [Rhodospirillales bacterium]